MDKFVPPNALTGERPPHFKWRGPLSLIWYMNYIFVVPPKCHRDGYEVRVSASFFNQTQTPYPQNYICQKLGYKL